MQRSQYWTLAIGAALCALGCSSLHEQSRTIKLSGNIVYDAYQEGIVRVMVCESESSTYEGKGQIAVQTPGDCVSTTDLAAPGPFSIKADVSWANGNPPNAEILVYLIADESSAPASCSAGAFISVSATTSHAGLEIVLEDGLCPMRE